MKITIDIVDDVAPAIIQNVALAMGWTIADDEQGRALLAAHLVSTISQLSKNGTNIRKRNEEQAAINEAVKGITGS